MFNNLLNKVYSTLSVIGGISVVFAIVAIMGMSGDDGAMVSNSDKVISYIPSNITKANPNFVIEHGESLWRTTNIADVKDQVVYTLRGTVLSIDDPIDYNVGGSISSVTGTQQIIGFIPVTISVDNVYKGDLTDNEFTFYITSHKYNDHYNLPPDSENFEMGEDILIHLAKSELDIFPNGRYYSVLAEFSKYQLQNLTGNISTDDANIIASDSILAFNIHHPNGVSLNSIIGESLP